MCWSPESPLKVPWRFWTLGPLGDLQGTSLGRRLPAGTTLNAKINDVKNEIPSTTFLATTTALNVKMNEIKNKIPIVTNLATTIALTPVEYKIPDHSKYITTPEFN